MSSYASRDTGLITELTLVFQSLVFLNVVNTVNLFNSAFDGFWKFVDDYGIYPQHPRLEKLLLV